MHFGQLVFFAESSLLGASHYSTMTMTMMVMTTTTTSAKTTTTTTKTTMTTKKTHKTQQKEERFTNLCQNRSHVTNSTVEWQIFSTNCF